MLGQRFRKLKLRQEAKPELVAAMATEPGGPPWRCAGAGEQQGDLARPAPRPRPPSRD